jgi:hypothetical protein
MVQVEGRITYEQFVSACSNFMELPATKLESCWKFDQSSQEFGESFLSYNSIRRHNDQKLLQYRYDVVYSVSHCVPVLYFMISEASGKHLSLDEVWEMFNQVEKRESSDSSWNVVSLQDHPVLHIPFYCVHPCNNWAIMKECFEEKKEITCQEFLISWMSMVGNQFGLQLSPAYFKNRS